MLTGLRAVALPLAISLIVQAAVTLAAMSIPVLAPRLGPALGVSPAWSGYYVALLYSGAVLTSLAARGIVPRFGPVTASIGALALTALGLGLFPTGLILPAAVGTLVMGLGYGFTNPASAEILAERTPRDMRGLVFSLKQTGVPLGAAAAGVLVPPLQGLLEWRATLVTVVLLCLLLAALLVPLRGRFDRDRRVAESHGRTGSPALVILRTPGLRNLAFASFGFAAMQLSLASFLVVHLVEEAGLDLVTAGLLFAVAQTAGIVGRVIWGWLADHLLKARTTLVVMALTMAACAVLTGQVGPAWPIPVLIALFVAFGASAIAWNGVFMAEVVRLAPVGEAAAATGGALAFTFSGVVAGPPIFALTVALAGSYAAAYVLVAALALGAGALVARI